MPYYLSLFKYNRSSEPIAEFRLKGKRNTLYVSDDLADRSLLIASGAREWDESRQKYSKPILYRHRLLCHGQVLRDTKNEPVSDSDESSVSSSSSEEEKVVQKSRELTLPDECVLSLVPRQFENLETFEFILIAGPTGVGKTTLARTLVDMMLDIRPDLQGKVVMVTSNNATDPAMEGLDLSYIEMSEDWAPPDKESIQKRYEKQLKQYEKDCIYYNKMVDKKQKEDEKVYKEKLADLKRDEAEEKRKAKLEKAGKPYVAPTIIPRPDRIKTELPEMPEPPIQPDFESLGQDDSNLDRFEHSIMIFDDYDHENKKIEDIFQRMLNQLLRCGRKRDISVIHICHQLMEGHRSKGKILESRYVCVFPQGDRYQIERFLEDKEKMSRKDIDKIVALNSRWVALYRAVPRMVLHEHGCYLL